MPILLLLQSSIKVGVGCGQWWIYLAASTKYWNTQAYNVTNVNDDGTIPNVFQENYLVPAQPFLNQVEGDYRPFG